MSARSGRSISFSGLPRPVAPGPRTGSGSARRGARAASRRRTARTISTYSRVLPSGLPNGCAVPALDHLRPRHAEPEQEAAAARAGRASSPSSPSFAGVRAGDLHDRRAELDLVVRAPSHASGVTASVPQASAAHTES